MNRALQSGLALAWGSLLSVLVYLVAGGVLVTVVQAVFAGEVDAQGHPFGLRVLMFDLVAQGVSAFLAGAVTLRFAGGRWWLATVAIGGVLMSVLAAATWAWGSASPRWFNVLSLAITPPFFALGAAWRAAGEPRPAA